MGKNLVLELTSKNAPFSEPLGAPKIEGRVYYFCRYFVHENGCKPNHSFGLVPAKKTNKLALSIFSYQEEHC